MLDDARNETIKLAVHKAKMDATAATVAAGRKICEAINIVVNESFPSGQTERVRTQWSERVYTLAESTQIRRARVAKGVRTLSATPLSTVPVAEPMAAAAASAEPTARSTAT